MRNIRSGKNPFAPGEFARLGKTANPAPAVSQYSAPPSPAANSPAPAPAGMAEKRKILISSNPSGAAIFINSRFSSQYTPNLIALEKNKVAHITLKKEGYFSKSFKFDPQIDSQSELNVNLTEDQQRDIASEDIHIIQ